MPKKPSLENIPINELVTGARLSWNNSYDLFKDAELLLNNKSYPRAYALYQLAIEESGKALLLLDTFTLRNAHDLMPDLDEFLSPINYKNIDRIFYDHQDKTKMILKIELYILKLGLEKKPIVLDEDDLSFLDEQVRISEMDLGDVPSLDTAKNVSLYTSIKNDKFVAPSQQITEEMVKRISDRAYFRINLVSMLLNKPEKFPVLFLQYKLKEKFGKTE